MRHKASTASSANAVHLGLKVVFMAQVATVTRGSTYWTACERPCLSIHRKPIGLWVMRSAKPLLRTRTLLGTSVGIVNDHAANAIGD